MAFTKEQLDAYIQALYDDDGQLSSADYQLIINYILSNGEPETDPRDLIQIRRGDAADLPALAQGEMAFTIDEERLYVGGLGGNVAAAMLKEVVATVNKLEGDLDNSNVLQNAINTTKIVRLQKDQIYRVENTLNLLSNTRIEGNGAKLEYYGDNACIFGDGLNNVTIENLEIEYKGTSGLETHGILLTNTTKIKIENVTSNKANGNGFFITHCDDVYINKCTCKENAKGAYGAAGALIGYNLNGGSSKILIENSIFSNNGTESRVHGVYISTTLENSTTTDFIVRNNIFENNAGGGINTNITINSLIVTNNIFRNNKTFGVALINAKNAIVADNEIYETGRLDNVTDNIAGVYVSGTHENIKIYNNLIDIVTSGTGIQLGGTSNQNLSIECYGNTIIGADLDGISYGGNGFNNVKISGNTIKFCGEHGIDINGTSEILQLKGVSIVGNVCFNNGRLSTFKAGIKAWNVSNSTISLNECYDNQQTKTQAYGLSGNNGNFYNSVKANRCYDNLAQDYAFKERTYPLDLNGFPVNFNTAPTTETWEKGEICYNNNPVGGAYRGFICIAAGTPGTWKGFGLIEV